jgi:Inner membrane component of T3SS, cytoplasmic domain
MNPPDSDNVIRITSEEALSEHVDDMLKRQMSMRGDPGVTRDHRRNWFYQNWFILGVVGMLGAIAAWALMEPVFDDMLYIQGEVTSVNESEELPGLRHSKKVDEDFAVQNFTSVTVRGEKLLLLSSTKEILSDGSHKRLKSDALAVGDKIGAYVEYMRGTEQGVILAEFILRDPKPQSASRAKLTLEQLQARHAAAGLLLFPLVAGLIGLFVGAADGIVCRLPRRAILCGLVGLLVGFIGGFICGLIANIVYAPLSQLAMRQSGNEASGLTAFGFIIQMIGRSLAWCLAGMAMGLGQGIALRSKRLLLYGLLGGVVGGLFGGMLFDPIDMILLGPDKPSAHWSRLIGFAVIGLCVGGMIGIVELLARDAWLRMTQGPLTGKEFLIFKDVMNVGASPRSDIYLFNDPLVAAQHATLRALGDECEIEARDSTNPVLLNNRPIKRARLRHGDNVTVGRTSFVFQQRKS